MVFGHWKDLSKFFGQTSRCDPATLTSTLTSRTGTRKSSPPEGSEEEEEEEEDGAKARRSKTRQV